MSEETKYSEEDRKERRILIVDDNADFSETLVDILGLCSYETAMALNTHQACEVIRDFSPEVALIDIRLGTGSGIDLISEFKEISPKTICVMMTAFATTETAIEALQQGAYDYLRKPISTGDLFIALERCFEKRQLERDKIQIQEDLKQQQKEIETFSSRLRVVNQSTSRFAKCDDFEKLGALILQEFARNMGAKGGSFFLRKDDNLELIHTLDPGHAPQSLPLPLKNDTPFERAIRTARPQLIHNILTEAEIKKSGWDGYKDDSFLLFPLTDHEGHVAALMALHDKNEAPFTPQDCALGAILASFSCETIRASQAIEKLQSSEERFRALIESIQEILREPGSTEEQIAALRKLLDAARIAEKKRSEA